MTRADYLNQLEQALFQLHPSARQEALDYFNEYFDEKENDEQAIQELGSPKEAAHEILANLYYPQYGLADHPLYPCRPNRRPPSNHLGRPLHHPSPNHL